MASSLDFILEDLVSACYVYSASTFQGKPNLKYIDQRFNLAKKEIIDLQTDAFRAGYERGRYDEAHGMEHRYE